MSKSCVSHSYLLFHGGKANSSKLNPFCIKRAGNEWWSVSITCQGFLRFPVVVFAAAAAAAADPTRSDPFSSSSPPPLLSSSSSQQGTVPLFPSHSCVPASGVFSVQDMMLLHLTSLLCVIFWSCAKILAAIAVDMAVATNVQESRGRRHAEWRKIDVIDINSYLVNISAFFTMGTANTTANS